MKIIKEDLLKVHANGDKESACEYDNGDKAWFFNGKLHRENGPACEWGTGSKAWYFNGKLHREGGPACEYVNGYKSWYLNGDRYSEHGNRYSEREYQEK